MDLDLFLEAERVGGEVDGRVTDFDERMHRGDPAAVVYAEKLREDRVRARDIRVTRWGWAVVRGRVLPVARLVAAGVVPIRSGPQPRRCPGM